MKKLPKIFIFLLIVFDIYLFGKILLGQKNIQVLNPRGWIALQEKNLMLVAIAIMLIVVIPVFIWAFYVAKKYHASNTKATYMPDWNPSITLQILLWAFPTFIICILSIINWISAHQLDPHNDIATNAKTMTIQVIAARWKWVFVYPEEGIATVNTVVFPEKTPINFELTASDTPMNSFWIPQLGGQIYAMGGMATQTHLIADGSGVYRGSNAEINGEGFADMTFIARSVSQSDFTSWVTRVKQTHTKLTMDAFNDLSKPSINYPVSYFSSTENNLYTTIVMKYMAQQTKVNHMASETMSGIDGR